VHHDQCSSHVPVFRLGVHVVLWIYCWPSASGLGVS
jgi:hypothetical protein